MLFPPSFLLAQRYPRNTRRECVYACACVCVRVRGLGEGGGAGLCVQVCKSISARAWVGGRECVWVCESVCLILL